MRNRTGCHLIVGLEEARTWLTIASVKRRQFEVHSNRRVEGALDPQALARLVRESVAASQPRPQCVHVICGGRHATRFSMDLPRLKRGERQIVLERRARQESGLAPEEPVRIAALRGGRLAGGLTRWQVSVFPSRLFELLKPLQEDSLLRVETISVWEDAALHALPKDLPRRAVVLDHSQRGIRIAYLTDGTLSHERLVRLTLTADSERTEAIRKLRFELSRTLDYFAGEGSPAPAGVAFSPGLGLSPEEATEVAGSLALFKLDLPTLGPTENTVALPPLGLLRALSGRGDMPLLDAGRSVRPKGTLVATILLSGLLTGSVLGMERVRTLAAQAITASKQVLPALEALHAERADLLVALAPDEDETPAEQRLRRVLGTRRPASRLLADVLLRLPPNLVIRELGYDQSERIHLRGESTSGRRLTGVEALATLQKELETLPYLGEVEVRVTYPPAAGASVPAVRFELITHWRSRP